MARRPWIVAIGGSWSVLGCTDPATYGRASAEDWVREERAALGELRKAPIPSVRGRIVTRTGDALPGAEIRLGSLVATSGNDGAFVLHDVPRRNAMLHVTRRDWLDEHVAVHLAVPMSTTSVVLPDIALAARGPGLSHLMFGGDVSLGRRYLDPDGETPLDRVPPDNPEALIRTSNPHVGTQRVLEGLPLVFEGADFVSVNLESVVTDEPRTPNVDNTFVFFTLPGSIPALLGAGIDYVALANDHIYDYLDAGVADTIAHLDHHGMPHSGAGASVDEAFEAHRTTLNGTPYAFLSLVSIEGIPVRNETGATTQRSGAADLNDDARIAAALERERQSGHVPIVNIHTGYEYTEEPPDAYTLERLEFVAQAGASLIVAHHPHVAQGFAFHDGTLIAHSLGNLAFDQYRFETFFGMVLSVGLQGDALTFARGIPIFIENFKPRPVTGEWADAFLRRIASSSHPYGTSIDVVHAKAHVHLPGESQEVVTRTVQIDVVIGDEAAVVDLRGHREPGESFSKVELGPGLKARPGRDLMVFGNMEDHDVDDDFGELAPWWYTGDASFPCVNDVWRGTFALCSIRDDGDGGPSVVSLRSRVRVLGDKLNAPNKDLSVFGYARGDGSGELALEVFYDASTGSREFGSKRAQIAEGNYGWRPFTMHLDLPPDTTQIDPEAPFAPIHRELNARGVRIRFEHHPPSRGAGIVRLDDVALVSWDRPISSNADISVPHPHDFLRIEGPRGPHTLTVTFAH